MKKVTSLIISLIFFVAGTTAQSYHFQEGFVKSTPDGWTRNCAGTTSLNHGLYEGDAAGKFDKDNNGIESPLESPAVNGAGTLTFWLSRNANAVYFDVHVCKIVNGQTTELLKVINTDIARKEEWSEITVQINDPSDNIKIMFWAEDAGESGSFLAIDDIALTTYEENGGGGEEPGEDTIYERITTNFNDGTWGTIANALPTSGEYPTYTINDFTLNKAIVYAGSTTDQAGERHVNRIGIDKKNNGGAIELPLLKDIGQLEIHAAVGTAGNTFNVDEYINNQWVTLETFSAIKTDSTFYLNLQREDVTRLRIANNSGGSVVIWKVVTRSMSDVRDLNIMSTTPTEGAVCFYNLTNEVTVRFNKNIKAGDKAPLLNGNEIPLSQCTISENIVIIPVELEGIRGANKAYTLHIPAGAFIDINEETNINKEFTLNFEALRKPNLPAHYQEMIDIIYSDASEEMCRMDFYYPSNATEPTPVVINMHGGGWNHGAKEEQTGFGTFQSLGFAIANVEYRMTPQATAPAAVEDIRCALQYLLKNAESLNINPEQIVFQGASAGGHLALTAAYLQNNRIYDTNCNDYEGNINIMAVIDKYGPADLTNFMFYTSLVNWLGEYANDQEFINSISPAMLVNENTPPTYIVHGDEDPTVPYSQSVTLQEKLKEYDIHHQFTTIPGGGHGGFESQYNTQISEEITTFLTGLLKTNSISTTQTPEEFRPVIKGNTVYLNYNDNTLYEIYDSNGNKFTETSAQTVELAAKGVFIIKAITHNKIVTAKIVK